MIGERESTQKKAHKVWLRSRIAVRDGDGNLMYTLAAATDLLRMLTGERLPPGMKLDRQPSLHPQEAFSVIWFLQEHLGVFSTNYEMCSMCNALYDAHRGGFYLDIDSYHEDSDWYDNVGVTEEMIARHAGRHFCSAACEREFWTHNHREGDHEK